MSGGEPHWEIPEISPEQQVQIDHLKGIADKFDEIRKGLSEPLKNFLGSEYLPLVNATALEGYVELLQFSLEEDEYSPEEMLDYIFKPTIYEKGSREVKAFSELHLGLYSEEVGEDAEYLMETEDAVLVYLSGMYGGKSTRERLTVQILETRGYTVKRFVAGILGDPFTEARAMPNGGRVEADRMNVYKVDGDGQLVVNDNGELIYDLEEYEKIIFPEIMRLKQQHGDEFAISLDEFTFMPEEFIERFINDCKGHQIKLLLLGLEHDHRAVELAPAALVRHLQDEGKLEIRKCKSFTANQDFELGTTPMGDRTQRYVVFPDGRICLDLSVLPLVVSKSLANLVRYVPIELERHYGTLLNKRGKNGRRILRVVRDDNAPEQEQRVVTLEKLKAA